MSFIDYEDDDQLDHLDAIIRSRSKRIRHWHACAECGTEFETFCEGRNSFGLWECECPSLCENCTEFERQKVQFMKQNLGIKKEKHGH